MNSDQVAKKVPLKLSAELISKILSLLSVVFIIIPMLSSSRLLFPRTVPTPLKQEVQFQKVQQIQIEAIEAQISKLQNEMQTSQENIQSAISLPKQVKFGAQLLQIQSAIKDIQMRQGKLEQVILANPSKAMEIPLLQRDLEHLQAAQQANILAVKEGVDRVYDLNKWLLGAISVSVITLAIANFLKGK